MARRRPVIGVTGGDLRLAPSWPFIRRAIGRAGGRARRLTPDHPQPPTPLDGMVISGGEDIAPDLYGGLTHGTAPRTNPRRDAFEMQALDTALQAGIPVLGICRGAQLLNVVLGGTLHQDLRALRRRTGNRRSALPCKPVALRPHTRLALIFGLRRFRVNSLHHQAIRALGAGLIVTARDADGIVQAVERPGAAFILGVQWHPEYLPYQAHQRRLFAALVAAAARDNPR